MGIVELNHCWVHLTQCWVNILQFISSTFLHTPGLSINHKTTQPPTPFYILSCCNSAAQLPFSFPPVTWSPPYMTPSLHSFTPFYSPSVPPLYSPFLLTCHKTTPRSQDHPSKWLASHWHSFSTFPVVLCSLRYAPDREAAACLEADGPRGETEDCQTEAESQCRQVRAWTKTIGSQGPRDRHWRLFCEH